MAYDKRELMQDVCNISFARESMYAHLPEEAHNTAIIDAGRVIASDMLKVIGFGASSRTPEEGAALIGVICDDMLFALQEAAKLL